MKEVQCLEDNFFLYNKKKIWKPHRLRSYQPLVSQFSIYNLFTCQLHFISLFEQTRPSVSYRPKKVVQEHHLLVCAQHCRREAACRCKSEAILFSERLCHCCCCWFDDVNAQMRDVFFVLFLSRCGSGPSNILQFCGVGLCVDTRTQRN